MGSGPLPALREILEQTELIVRGFIGEKRSYLSEDQKHVQTDYRIDNANVVYDIPGPTIQFPLVVSVNGGTITMDGNSYTEISWVERLSVRSECLLLLARQGDSYRLVGGSYGAFIIEAGKVKALTPKALYAPEIVGATEAEAIARMLDTLKQR